MEKYLIPTSKSILARNTFLNIIGLSLPFLVGIIAIPLIISGLGTERFGLLSLGWVILGYVGIFDLGLGRATTKFVASALGRGERDGISSIFWTAALSQVILGSIASLLVISLTPFFAQHILKIPEALVSEAQVTFYLLALTIPVVLLQSSFSAILEVFQRFDLINAVKVPASSLTFIIAAMAAPAGFGLPTIIILLFISRFIATFIFFLFCLRVFPPLRSRPSLKPKLLRPLLSFGGWVTVSNVLAPLLVYFDRFLIGSLRSVDEVAYYTAPYDIVTKLWILPTSLVVTLFPIFSSLGKRSKESLTNIMAHSIKYLLLIMGPLILILSVLAKKILSIWLGPEFALRSALTLQILSWGVLINSLAHLPFTMLQGIGRPDLPAKFHLLEVPFYISLAWYLIVHWGINGAALAWSIRVTLDAFLLYYAAVKVGSFSVPSLHRASLERYLALFSLLILACLLATHLDSKPLIMALTLIGSFLAFYAAAWKFLLSLEEKDFLYSFLRLRRKLAHASERTGD